MTDPTRVLFLDDNPARCRRFRDHCPGGAVVTNAAEAIQALQAGSPWSLVFLDHDLEQVEYADPGGDNTGSAVVRWIAANRPRVSRFIIHTLNERGAQGMLRGLKGAGYRAKYVSFMRLIDRFDEELRGSQR